MRLADVAEHFGDRVAITRKSFLLRTEPKTTSLGDFVQYSRKWSEIGALEPRADFVPWSIDTKASPPSSSMPAQMAAKLVERDWPSASEDVHWALLRAYFSEGRDISDEAELAKIVGSVGVDSGEFVSNLGRDRADLRDLVVSDHYEATDAGITAVPTTLINGIVPVPGAQETATYIRWITRILESQA